MAAGDVRYDCEVIAVGELADQFFAAGIVVLFGEGVPEELADFAVVHRPTITTGGLRAGDRIHLGATEIVTVLAVGDVADENLVALGHLSLKRNGEIEAALPGDVCCDEGPLPEFGVGDRIRIVAGS
ncbi:MAG: PTS glucitol/sorbitol transporter subunit IIA [Nitriliruptoraceae bacterium]|nr:PTS glucitol/sorbitol transporter subunit IIA [Nitriliruptoraceae bacterium]